MSAILDGVCHRVVEDRVAGTPFAAAWHDWGIVEQRPFPYSEAIVAEATDALRDLADQCDALDVDGVIEQRWPDAMASPVPRVDGRVVVNRPTKRPST